MPLLEVIPVDAAAELLDRAALVHDARRRVLLQCVQQQGGQQKGPKVVGAQGYLQSYMHTCEMKISREQNIEGIMGQSYRSSQGMVCTMT